MANAVHWPLEMVRLNMDVRSELYARAGKPVAVTRARDFIRLQDSETLSLGLMSSPNYSVVSGLEKLRHLPLAVRRRSALFIPQDEKKYWTILSRSGDCSFQSFVAPALATLALVNGTPPLGCKLNRYYGLGSYSARTKPENDTDRTPASLCVRATQMGADRVITLRFPADSSIATVVSCGGRL